LDVILLGSKFGWDRGTIRGGENRENKEVRFGNAATGGGGGGGQWGITVQGPNGTVGG